VTLTQAPSPNFNRRAGPPDMIILHYTGMPTGREALERLCDPGSKVSAHYLVEEDGRLFALVPEARRAWHAGASFWRGQRDINSASIGIEIVNPGHAWGYRPFPEAQIDVVVDLVADIRSRWTVPDARILAHSDVAPERREDPGELFPWRRLAEAGHGLWSDAAAAPGGELKEGDEGPDVSALQAGFARLGYDLPPSGRYEAATATVVRAFQRHWRGEQVDGRADGQTRARLIGLLRLAAADLA
jgi:N-acetylmuramoyl-L-alanine amidase